MPLLSTFGAASAKGFGLNSLVIEPIVLGLSNSLDTYTGEGTGTYIETRNVDVAAYGGRQVKVVFHYVNGTTGTSYQGDAQIDDIVIGGTTYDFTSDAQSWETTASDTAAYSGATFASVATATTQRWFNRTTVAPPSTGTGVDMGPCLYAETTGNAGTMPGFNFWTRSPTITLPSSPTMSYRTGRFGSNIGTMNVHLDVIV